MANRESGLLNDRVTWSLARAGEPCLGKRALSSGVVRLSTPQTRRTVEPQCKSSENTEPQVALVCRAEAIPRLQHSLVRCHLWSDYSVIAKAGYNVPWNHCRIGRTKQLQGRGTTTYQKHYHMSVVCLFILWYPYSSSQILTLSEYSLILEYTVSSIRSPLPPATLKIKSLSELRPRMSTWSPVLGPPRGLKRSGSCRISTTLIGICAGL